MEITKVDLPLAVDGQADIPTGHPWLPSLYFAGQLGNRESPETPVESAVAPDPRNGLPSCSADGGLATRYP